MQLKQSILDETDNRRTGVERTNDAGKDCGIGDVRARGRVHARTDVSSRCVSGVSSRYVSGSSLQSPISSGEMIRVVRSSSYEMGSMTRSWVVFSAPPDLATRRLCGRVRILSGGRLAGKNESVVQSLNLKLRVVSRSEDSFVIVLFFTINIWIFIGDWSYLIDV